MNTQQPDRLIALEAVHNFRDMGGYRTHDGHSVRWQLLYRADNVGRLAGDDIEAVRELGLRTVIDLRTDNELAERGYFPLDEIRVHFHQVSIMDSTWQHASWPQTDDAVEFLLGAYRQMLDHGAERLAEAIQLIALPGALPAVFHCAAGKDRTGLVAALILAAIGVVDEEIISDYALTAEAVLRTKVWAESNLPDLYERMSNSPKQFMAAEPMAMRLLLDELRSTHGSIEHYLDSIGIGEAIRDQLREALLDT